MSVTLSFKGYSLIWHITYLEHMGNYSKKTPTTKTTKKTNLPVCALQAVFSPCPYALCISLDLLPLTLQHYDSALL